MHIVNNLNIDGDLIVGSTNILDAITNLQNNGGGGGGNVDTSSFVQQADDATTRNLTTSGDVEAHDHIATNELHVGSTNTLKSVLLIYKRTLLTLH